MPLSKKRDKERKRLSRLEWLSSPSQESRAAPRKRGRPVVIKPSRYCDACGEDRVIDGHHIAEDTLVDLCPTCHAVIHRKGLSMNELLYKYPSNAVQPKLDPPPRFDDIFFEGANNMDKIDADGEPIYEEG